MTGELVAIAFLCFATTAREDCDRTSAIDVIIGPKAKTPLQCLEEAQQLVAGNFGWDPLDGQYWKLSCEPWEER
jgi:hypothetical protein